MSYCSRKTVAAGFTLLMLAAPFSLAEVYDDISTVAAFEAALSEAAGNGEDDVINLAAVTFILSSTLTFVSAEDHSLTINGASRAGTVLDGDSATQIMSFSSDQPGAHFTIQHLTMQHGITTAGGGALVAETSAASITVDDCEISDNASTGTTDNQGIGGGANLFSSSNTVTVSNSYFRRNSAAQNVGGAYIASSTGTVSLSGSTFDANTVNNTGSSDAYGDAGGAELYTDAGGDIEADDNVFQNNAVTGGLNPDGGGLMAYPLGNGGTTSITNNTFANNQADNGGGGFLIHLNDSGTLVFSDNHFTGNSANGADGGGAHLYVNQGNANVERNTFTSNEANGSGGGLRIEHHVTGTITVRDNVFTSNDAGENGGGASVYVDSGTLDFSRNILDGNTAGNVGGGFDFSTSSGTLNLSNSTFYGNSGTSDGGAVYCYSGSSAAPTNLRNLILWNSSPNELAYDYAGGALTVTYSSAQGSAAEDWFDATTCNAVDPPLFADPANHDFQLTWSNFPTGDSTKSPCIDTGDPSSLADPDGTRADMGAHFFDQGGGVIFIDGFELGNTTRWSATVQ